MNLIWAIRELCSGEDGFENLFDQEETYQRLIDLSDDKKEATLFAVLLYGRARPTLIEMIHDVSNYKAYAVKIQGDLVNSGMSEADAKRTIEIFYEAFGFPEHRRCDPARVGVVISENGDFRSEYQGEVKDGKAHGIGIRNCYYNGKWCDYDEGVWVNGAMCGYDSVRELELEMFENRKIGFVVDDGFIGKTKVIPAEDEEFYELGRKLDIQ